MFEGLCFVATLGSAFLFMIALSEAIELDEQKTQARREEMRKAAYAVKRSEWLKRQNRRTLWAEVSGDVYNLD